MLHDTDVYGVDSEHVPADPHDAYEERLEFQAALQELHKLPEHLRAVVLLNAALGRSGDQGDRVIRTPSGQTAGQPRAKDSSV